MTTEGRIPNEHRPIPPDDVVRRLYGDGPDGHAADSRRLDGNAKRKRPGLSPYAKIRNLSDPLKRTGDGGKTGYEFGVKFEF